MPHIPKDRANSVKFNQEKCYELIENTQNQMTDIELEALSHSSLFNGLKEQMGPKPLYEGEDEDP